MVPSTLKLPRNAKDRLVVSAENPYLARRSEPLTTTTIHKKSKQEEIQMKDAR
jgi:hypothetical protein